MMKLTNVNMKSDWLPVDLVMEILKRLPVKTLIRFLSVSNLWASTIRSRDFMKLFLNVSLTRPKGLLFLFRHGYYGLVLSPKTHQPSSFTTFHVNCHSPQWSTVFPSVHGLICYAQATRLVIYNPCTRRSIALREIDTWRRPIRYHLGYDPIENAYKVLCAMLGGMRDIVKEFRVLTLGTENSWKKIENNITSHVPFGQDLCISGVLYYQAFSTDTWNDLTITSFDVRSEKLSHIKGLISSSSIIYMHNESSKLISYEEKLAVLFFVAKAIRLCVLEDAAKEEWSTKIFVLSTSIPDLNWYGKSRSTVTDTGEIITAPRFLHASVFNLDCYDLKTSSDQTVYILGNITEDTGYYVESLSSNLVENLMFL
ncbi:putative F-box protein At4g38870 [Raphanus sativus]|uniref:F-box protein At4g38870 n=1 Tax=Raphanus sativus TaxID=3726 RepID=A0A6J0MT32_RAPSA|nr:putative F-box protein At4g38870 [Raphanus sativus]